MVAELRKTVRGWAIYTNDVFVYKHLSKYAAAGKVPYIKNGKMVGVDFYFDKKHTRTAKKVARGQLFLGI